MAKYLFAPSCIFGKQDAKRSKSLRAWIEIESIEFIRHWKCPRFALKSLSIRCCGPDFSKKHLYYEELRMEGAISAPHLLSTCEVFPALDSIDEHSYSTSCLVEEHAMENDVLHYNFKPRRQILDRMDLHLYSNKFQPATCCPTKIVLDCVLRDVNDEETVVSFEASIPRCTIMRALCGGDVDIAPKPIMQDLIFDNCEMEPVDGHTQEEED